MANQRSIAIQVTMEMENLARTHTKNPRLITRQNRSPAVPDGTGTFSVLRTRVCDMITKIPKNHKKQGE